MRAWHFVGDKLRDGRPVPPIGFKLIHTGEVVPCQSGLHASEHPFDALKYAPGNTLCLVELSGKIVHHGNDKVVASERAIIKSIDAEKLMRRFAKDQALSVIHLWNAPKIVKDYLEGDDESLRSASASSYAAAAAYASAYASASSYAAARASSSAAASAYASAYASASSYAAARASSSAAASAYASYTIRQKFVEKQRAEFEKRVMDAFCL